MEIKLDIEDVIKLLKEKYKSENVYFEDNICSQYGEAPEFTIKIKDVLSEVSD